MRGRDVGDDRGLGLPVRGVRVLAVRGGFRGRQGGVDEAFQRGGAGGSVGDGAALRDFSVVGELVGGCVGGGGAGGGVGVPEGGPEVGVGEDGVDGGEGGGEGGGVAEVGLDEFGAGVEEGLGGGGGRVAG